MKLLKKTLYYAVFAAAAYAVIKATTFGWLFRGPAGALPAGKPGISELKLRAHVVKLAGEIGDRDLFRNDNPKLRAAADYIASELERYGYRVEYQGYRSAGVKVKNVIAIKPGRSRPGEVILVGAHYDTCDNPGADDNASGVAGTLELARRLSGKPLDRTVKFAAFVNEEPPFFRTADMGSFVYASAAAGKKEDLKGAIILEMIGYFADKPFSQHYPPLIGVFYPNRGNFLALVGNFASRELALAIRGSFKAASALPLETAILPAFVPGVDFSDHRSFWKFGYPAVMFTDTSFYRNANYHKPTDTPGTLDYARMAVFIDGLEKAVSDLAG